MDLSPLSEAHRLVEQAEAAARQQDFLTASKQHRHAGDLFKQAAAELSEYHGEAKRVLLLLFQEHARVSDKLLCRHQEMEKGKSQDTATGEGLLKTKTHVDKKLTYSVLSTVERPGESSGDRLAPKRNAMLESNIMFSRFLDSVPKGKSASVAFAALPLEPISHTPEESFYMVPSRGHARKGKKSTEEIRLENTQLRNVINTLIRKQSPGQIELQKEIARLKAETARLESQNSQ